MNDETDDLGLSDEFLADECIAREEDNYGRERRCTCGYRAAREEMQHYHHDREDIQQLHEQYPGCRGCDPVDHESKPYGWGIESFEDPALQLANAATWAEIDKRGGYKYTSASCSVGTDSMGRLRWYGPRAGRLDMAFRDACWSAWTKHNLTLERVSERVWDALCECCKSHKEAVRRYASWCKRRGLKKR